MGYFLSFRKKKEEVPLELRNAGAGSKAPITRDKARPSRGLPGENPPHLSVLYDGASCSSRRGARHGINRSSVLGEKKKSEAFPVPGCVAAGHPHLVRPDRLAGVMGLPVRQTHPTISSNVVMFR